jgi:hypothetical protein
VAEIARISSGALAKVTASIPELTRKTLTQIFLIRFDLEWFGSSRGGRADLGNGAVILGEKRLWVGGFAALG